MTRYAFLGPSGTFTEEALLSLHIPDLEAIACSSIEDVFAAVEDGRAASGIVPIENSVEGSVNATLDALAFDSSLTIHREVVLDINHALIAEPGATLDEIEIVASHPHATAQCRRWLAEHLPGRTIAAANSTAEAVQRAVAEHGVAVRGHARRRRRSTAASMLADAIGDYADNKTRFVVVGRSVAGARRGRQDHASRSSCTRTAPERSS
jgi:prephenate dehydratase